MKKAMNTLAPRGARPRLGDTVGGIACVPWFILGAALMLTGLSCESSDMQSTSKPSRPVRTEGSDDLSIARGWALMQAEIERLAKLPPASNGNEARERLDRSATAIGAKLDRGDIEQMIRTADKAFPPPHKDTYYLTTSLSGMVIARVVDPNDEHRLVSRSQRWGASIDWHALAMAGIDLYHDQRSFNLLMEVGMKDETTRHGRREEHWTHSAVEALGFLRGYDSDDNARAGVERRLRVAVHRSKQDGVSAGQAACRTKYLKALIASWDYAEGLNESKRKEYQGFERHLWRAWSLSRGGSRRKHGRFIDAARLLRWREGDEGFFLRLFESPGSTPEEVLIAEWMALRFSEDGQRRLQAVASGDSLWARNAERALLRMKRARRRYPMMSPMSRPVNE